MYLELSVMVFSSLVEGVHKQSRFQNKNNWDFLEIFGVFLETRIERFVR